MPDGWTYVVKEPERSALLFEMGVPKILISLGSGKVPHPVFDFYCKPPNRVIPDDKGEGPKVVAIYESQYDEGFACRKVDGSIEYVCVNLRNPADVAVYGGSEQALLRALFEMIVDSEYNTRDEINSGAAAIGFECLADTYAFIFAERERAMQGQRRRDMTAYHQRKLDYIRGVIKPGQDNPGV